MGNVSNRLAQWAKWGRSWEELEDGRGTIGGVRQTDKDGVRLFIPCDSIVGSAIDPVGTGAEVADWLYGISDSGKHIALRNCMAVSILSDSQELSASTMLSGNEAFDISASIRKVSFGLQHLEDWAILKTDNGDNVFQTFLKDHSSSGCIEQTWYTDDRLKIIVRAGMNLKCNLPASVNLEQRPQPHHQPHQRLPGSHLFPQRWRCLNRIRVRCPEQALTRLRRRLSRAFHFYSQPFL